MTKTISDLRTVMHANPARFDNPNEFFVFTIDPSALPTYVPQQLDAGD